MSENLKVLVVDDTVTYRKVLSDVAAAIPGSVAAGTASGGDAALRRLAEGGIDVVLLDVFMPDMDGVETLSHIRRDYPGVFVVMVSGATTKQADITIRALEMGAIDFVPKPTAESYEAGVRELTEALTPIFRAIRLKRGAAGETASVAAPAVGAARFAPRPARFDAVVVGVSTGGPNALKEVVAGLPRDLGAPVLVVQHMPPLFTASLARNLAKEAQLDVAEAQDGQAVRCGQMLIAPGGRHMTVRSEGGTVKIGLNDTPAVNGCRPSADVLFRSAATAYAGGVLAVVMTGMGEDGAAGVAALKRKGCYCLAQSEETCVVYGMPRVVVERGLSDEVPALDRLAGRIAELVGRRAE